MKLLQFFEATNPNVKVKKKGNIYHAYLKSKWVGQAMVYDHETDGMADNERHIWKSAVDPSMTRQGIATELYNVIADDLESQGLKLVPSPDQQLSGDAYQFWKARDPESIKNHGTFKAEKLQHYIGREIEVRGRPAVVRNVGWSKSGDAPLIGVRFTDVPEGSVNSTSHMRMADVTDQFNESVDEKFGKSVVWDNGQFFIAVNNPDKPTFFTAWTQDNEKVATLSTKVMPKNGEQWMAVDYVEVDPASQRQGIARALYHVMIDGMSPEYAGLFGYGPDIASQHVSKIYQRYGAHEQEDGHFYIPNPNRNVTEDETLNLPDLETGDELMVGKFKNRRATIKGFTKDKHNQPIAKTNKGDQQIFKGRVAKLMPVREDEGDGAAASPQVEAFYKEFYGITTPHPDDETARIIMANDGDGDYVVIQSKPEGDRVYLKAIQSTRPGWGHGGEAMQLFLGLTDKHGVPVDLSVEAVGNVEGGLDNQQLTDWYSELGFESHSKFGDRMFNIKRMKREPMTESFNRTTTEMPDYDKLIQSIDSEYLRDYFRDQKGKEAKMVDISPDEYLQAVDRGFDHGVMNGIEDEKVQRYAAKMKAGETFPALTLDYSRGYLSQEGRHRALAAKAVGIDSVPVLIVTPTPEEAEYRGITDPNPELLKTMKPRPMQEGPIQIGGRGESSPSITSFMSDYNTSTVSHPFRPQARIAMNREHNSGDDFAIIELQPQDNGIYLSSIQSSQGGKGNGSAGMKLLTDLADKHGVVLDLHVDSFGEAADALTNAQLNKWYRRVGFEPYGDGMIRYPS